MEDLAAYRVLLRADLAALADPEAWGAPLSESGQRELLQRIGRTLFHLSHQCENEVVEQRLLGAALRAAAPDVRPRARHPRLCLEPAASSAFRAR